MEITYKDFEIGEMVRCRNVDKMYDNTLTVGKDYIIRNLDPQFPDRLCVGCDGNYLTFVPIKFFIDKEWIRERKLRNLLED